MCSYVQELTHYISIHKLRTNNFLIIIFFTPSVLFISQSKKKGNSSYFSDQLSFIPDCCENCLTMAICKAIWSDAPGGELELAPGDTAVAAGVGEVDVCCGGGDLNDFFT